MYGIKAFSRPFDASDYRDKQVSRKMTSRSISFQDREEIRRKLTMDLDTEECSFGINRVIRKSSLSNRLRNGQSLQICFMNESSSDSHEEDNQSEDSKWNAEKTSLNNNSYNSNKLNFSKDSLKSSYLMHKFQNTDKVFQQAQSLSNIPKPKERSEFHDYHSKLHEEARSALAQAKSMAKMQMEVEKHIIRYRSSLSSLIDFPLHYHARKNKLTQSVLSNMSVAQLQIIVNDLFTHIEKLNQELVQLLVERDELNMEQDSILVDIEDLTIFLCSK